jgi:exosortase family protein XrtF
MLLGWLLVFYIWGEPAGGLDDQMTEITVAATQQVFEAASISATSKWFTPKATDEERRPMQMLIINGVESVKVGNRCNGLFTMVIYAGFIIAYPGSWRSKMFFVPIGIFMIFLSNVIRIGVLALNWIHYRSTFDFNHKYTYTFIVYGVVCVLWMWWINKYSFLATSQNVTSNHTKI